MRFSRPKACVLMIDFKTAEILPRVGMIKWSRPKWWGKGGLFQLSGHILVSRPLIGGVVFDVPQGSTSVFTTKFFPSYLGTSYVLWGEGVWRRAPVVTCLRSLLVRIMGFGCLWFCSTYNTASDVVDTEMTDVKDEVKIKKEKKEKKKKDKKDKKVCMSACRFVLSRKVSNCSRTLAQFPRDLKNLV